LQLVGIYPGRDEDQAVQAELLHRILRQQEMTVVDRIETASE
jgi:hypothetical protein